MTNHKRVNIKSVIADPVLREELVEGATDFICKVEGIRRDPLSPAAQAVLDAATNVKHPEVEAVAFQCTRLEVAAALRAAAEEVAPFPGRYPMNEYMEGFRDAKQSVHHQLNAIATELEGANG